MAKSSTTLDKKASAKMPPRGKAKRTLILEALKENGKTEQDFYNILVERALDPSDNFAFAELWKRFHPVEKATYPIYEFTMPSADATKLDKADAVINAISLGCLPIDAGKMLMDIIKDAATIEELEILAEKVANLERLYEQSSSKED